MPKLMLLCSYKVDVTLALTMQGQNAIVSGDAETKREMLTRLPSEVKGMPRCHERHMSHSV